MRGSAFNWFEPIMTDQLTSYPDQSDDETRSIFNHIVPPTNDEDKSHHFRFSKFEELEQKSSCVHMDAPGRDN